MKVKVSDRLWVGGGLPEEWEEIYTEDLEEEKSGIEAGKAGGKKKKKRFWLILNLIPRKIPNHLCNLVMDLRETEMENRACCHFEIKLQATVSLGFQ